MKKETEYCYTSETGPPTNPLIPSWSPSQVNSGNYLLVFLYSFTSLKTCLFLSVLEICIKKGWWHMHIWFAISVFHYVCKIYLCCAWLWFVHFHYICSIVDGYLGCFQWGLWGTVLFRTLSVSASFCGIGIRGPYSLQSSTSPEEAKLF